MAFMLDDKVPYELYGFAAMEGTLRNVRQARISTGARILVNEPETQ